VSAGLTLLEKGEHVECSAAWRGQRLGWTCPATHRWSLPRRGPADPVSRALGDAIRETRERRGETLEQVAHRIPRMDSKYLGEIERGWHSPTIKTVKRIADALGISVAELFKGL
jgi:ribosome-binding protein aMBF1 (putative translation factor)